MSGMMLAMFYSTASLVPFFSLMTYDHLQRNKVNSMLTFIFSFKKLKMTSVSPLDSDYTANLIPMDQLVGTLVKDGRHGRYEAYLAESWQTLNESKTWNFFLRKSLYDESGTPITAQNYIWSFKTLFKLYLKRSIPPAFVHLEGLQKFIDGNSDKLGIEVINDYQIQFKFTKRPSGLLQFLSMPYFGFYNKDNFIDGQWKDTKKIISSGAYLLSEWDGGDKMILTKRSDWFGHVKNSPQKVLLKTVPYDEAIKRNEKNVIIHKQADDSDNEVPEGYNRIFSTPTFLMSLVLSPFIKNFFDNPENRLVFNKKVDEFKKDHRINSQSYIEADNFFITNSSVKSNSGTRSSKYKTYPKKELKILVSDSESAINNYVKDLVKYALGNENIKYKFVTLDQKDPEWLRKYTSNTEYDLKFTSVNSGTQPENWVVKMMFCSKMGISFPDVDNKVCSLTQKYEDGLVNDLEYSKIFHQILDESKTVIPLFRTRDTWLYSKSLRFDNQSPTASITRFDLISLENNQ